ncbi:hypothetical protein AM232_16130 [Bacillus sp. FJAT-21352]|nr:hypothetical protein AM232_16130 [Bacillus sp. FJAT-21352]
MRNQHPVKIIQFDFLDLYENGNDSKDNAIHLKSLHLKKEPIMKYDRFLLCYIGGNILTHQLKKLIIPKNEKMSQNLIKRDARFLREMRVPGVEINVHILQPLKV